MKDEFKDIDFRNEEGEHCVPIHSIVRVDERNSEDILVWGDFWVFNYNQVGDTLKCIDFETANQEPSSVCSVGVVMVRDTMPWLMPKPVQQ